MTDTIEQVAHAPRQAATPALDAVRASKRYRRGGAWALRDVDLAIPTGRLTALVGPNGAGKSTLIRSFMGFERPTAGAVHVMGIDPQADRTAAIRQLGYVSQSTGLYRGLSVGDHLTLAGSLRRGFDRDVAVDRLGQLGIPLSQHAGELSGGQQAHLALSIALATHAPVLLLDEPLASLDPLARNEFLGILVREVRSRAATALLSSHIVRDVETACDDIVVLGSGRVMLHAPIAEALQTHRLSRSQVPGVDTVASFGTADGGLAWLLRASDESLPVPTLEELVMGYLAASRSIAAEQREAA